LRSATVLRLALVGLIVLLQSLELSDSFAWLTRTPLWLLPAVAINGLLALAGYTFSRSFERNGLAITLRRTAWRFLPTLVVVVASTAFVVGVALTVQRRTIYLSDSQVWTYLLNILGYPQNALPGVFLDNKLAASINDVTWVVPIAYISIVLMGLSASRLRFGSVMLAGVAVVSVGLGVLLQSDLLPYQISAILGGVASGRGLNGLIAMLAGAVAYRERSKLVVDRRIAALIGLGGVAFSLFGARRALDSAVAGPAVAIGAAYLALFAGSLRLPLRHTAQRWEPLLWRIFLLAYPVQQFWIAVGPSQQGVVLNLALSVPVIVILAGALWYSLELPILRRVAPGVVEGNPVYALQEQSKTGGRALSPLETLTAALPHVVAAVFIVLLTLGAIAIAVFALQRDPGGV